MGLIDETETEVYEDPNITSTGTELSDHEIIGSKQEGGSLERTVIEFILDPDKDYLVRYENNSTSEMTNGGFELFWYEP